VQDIGTTAKTMPDFPQLWADMLTHGSAGTSSAADSSGTGTSSGTED
jgi:3-phosphoshikimate 1-carboxyvinyltransferase